MKLNNPNIRLRIRQGCLSLRLLGDLSQHKKTGKVKGGTKDRNITVFMCTRSVFLHK